MTEYRPRELAGFDSFEFTLGDRLRGERATLGKSLLDIQRDLRIKASYIAAIENADLDVFPNRGFIAGYVRSYARYLKLDPDEVFEQFCAESGFKGVNADLKGVSRTKSPGVAASGRLQSLDDDPIARSRIGAVASGSSFEWSSSLSGLASLSVVVALIAALGYGGWSVLQELQRVEIAPIAQTPELVEESAVGFGFEELAAVSEDGILFDDARAAALAELYAPRATVPQELFPPRDGPIGTIDPDTVGSFVPATMPDRAVPDAAPALEPEAAVLVPEPPLVAVVAVEPAWIRVTTADGATIFEQIIGAGEPYVLPEGLDRPVLRAGNSGAVFLQVGRDAFGPLGTGARVARDVSLLPEEIAARWSLAELTDALDAAMAETAVAATAP
ncbi:MAG: helix-turn-helix domain-containing protein [Rubricella sp.]